MNPGSRSPLGATNTILCGDAYHTMQSFQSNIAQAAMPDPPYYRGLKNNWDNP